MTDVTIDIKVPAPDGTLISTMGTMQWTPSTSHVDGTTLVLPAPFAVSVTGPATISLKPTDATWCWQVRENFPVGGRIRYVAVPDSPTPVAYTALVDVDPTTLAPSNVAASSALTLAVSDARASATAAAQSATTAATVSSDASRLTTGTVDDARLPVTAQAATLAPMATSDLLRMASLGSTDRGRSLGIGQVAYQDAASFTEQWTNLTSWSSATFGQLSGGRLYSNGKGANSGANHGFPIASGTNLRALFNVRTIGGGAGGGLIVGVSTDAVGGAFTSGGLTTSGLYFTQAAVSAFTNGTAGGDLFNWGTSSSTVIDWLVTVTVDDTYLTITARDISGGTEVRNRWIRGTVNNITVFNSDPRLLSGHSVGPVGARAATVTVSARVGIEDVGTSVHWTAVGNAGIRIALPKSYDSRRPHPVVILFHGNGSNETHWASSANGKAVAEAFVSAGYIAVSAANSPNVSTWGAQASLDAYYAAYQYARDHYTIGPVVLYGNSMGGIESLLTLAERRIPGVVAWIGTSPTANLADNYANATFTSTINTAYCISGDYATKTAGHDPILMAGAAFRKVPMWALYATDDTAVEPATNWQAFATLVAPYATELVTVTTTGGHSTGAIASDAPQMVAFANKYVVA